MTLDRENFFKLKALLSRIPGKPTISGLVDELLTGFVDQMGPLLSGSFDDRAALLRQLTEFHSSSTIQQSLAFKELADTIRTKEAEEAGEE